MESKVLFLLDRTQSFTDQKAQILDELTLAIKNNTSEVPLSSFRANKPMMHGDVLRRIIIFGTTLTKFYLFAG
jgi:hypothetical protein